MTLEQMVHETYATHELLCQLGFEPAEIFVGALLVANGDPPGRYATVVLKSQGLQFVYNFARLDDDDAGDRYLEAFRAFAAGKSTMARERLDAIVRESDVWRQREGFLMALAYKGFRFTTVERAHQN